MSRFSKLLGQGEKTQADFVRTQHQPDGNTYEIYRASTRSAAIAFLRFHDVCEERGYAIVETPEGNVGKDFILIFDEKTQETIELGRRKLLSKPKTSVGRCCSCGYPVIPYRKAPDLRLTIGKVKTFLIIAEAKKNGAGYVRRSCGAICCAFCATPESAPLCVLCKREVIPYDG